MMLNSTSPEQGLVAEISRRNLVVLLSRFPNPSSSPDEFSALTDVPVFIGYMLSYFLNGILFVQVFVYYLSFRRTDPRYIQIIVLLIFLVECALTVCATEIVVYSIITQGYLSYSTLLPGFEAVAVLAGIASSMVHGFYCWRIRVLGGHWVVIVVIIILSLTQCITVSLLCASESLGNGDVLGGGTLSHSKINLSVIWLVGTALCDIIITSTIFYLQRGILKHFGDKDNQLATRVKKMMGIAIDTGLITAFAATVQLLLFLIFRDSLVMFCLFYPLPKLYANCAMATLNVRLTVPGRVFRESKSIRLDDESGKD